MLFKTIKCKCACDGILPIDALAQVCGCPLKRKTKRRIKKASTTTKKPKLTLRRKKMSCSERMVTNCTLH